MKSGIELIADERQRQIEVENRSAEHDSMYQNGELALAAVCYALPQAERNTNKYPEHWPWGIDYWKPCENDRVRELVKAGALIAAEIERLQIQTKLK